ncbi:MAG TPA: protein kinase [Candidatus Limnocylindrales bacterium]|nr:protein kinase [Candidatus Limnocylindrales bacterium]
MPTSRRTRIIGERYRVGPVIGRGGMATIHQATDLRLDREVAVKLLRPEIAKDADLAGRFRREALATTVLRHPNIVACLDTGTDGSQPYLVMDLVDGEDLAARLRRSGRLAPWQAARIGLDVARALGAAHVRGIVHRDVKPGNILLAGDGRAMVTDFGIARLAVDAEAARPGTTLGSVHYFSPEQARGTTTSPASDVYCLGLVLFEALTGKRAFTGDTSDAIALARVGAAAPSPRSIRPEIPADLETIVTTALAPDPADRYPNGNAMAAALEAAVVAADESSPTSVVAIPYAAVEDLAAKEATPVRAPARVAVSSRPGRTRGGRGTPPSAPRRARGTSGQPARTTPPGVVVALLALLGIVGGALIVAALPGAARVPLPSANLAVVASPTPRPTPVPTPQPTPRPTATPAPTAAPTALPAGEVGDLCEVFFDIPCGLGAGRYAPSRFRPEFDIELGDGWSTAIHREDVVELTRQEGTMTFAGKITEAYPNGRTIDPRARARDIIEAFIATKGVGATDAANVRIGGRRGLSTDLAPLGDKRVALFATEGSVFNLEPDRSTRIVVVDLKEGGTALIAIEPNSGFELADILETADAAAGTIRWRNSD